MDAAGTRDGGKLTGASYLAAERCPTPRTEPAAETWKDMDESGVRPDGEQGEVCGGMQDAVAGCGAERRRGQDGAGQDRRDGRTDGIRMIVSIGSERRVT